MGLHRVYSGRGRDRDRVVRMNISVPGSVMRQMSDFNATHTVNWSRVAAKAFARHVAAHARLAQWQTAAERRRLAQEDVFAQGG